MSFAGAVGGPILLAFVGTPSELGVTLSFLSFVAFGAVTVLAVAILDARRLRLRQAPSLHTGYWWQGHSALITATCVLILASAALVAPHIRAHFDGQYATAVGQTRAVKWPDGSSATLDTDSAMAVQFRLRGRHVELKRGEALFDVAQNKERPFTVTVADHSIEAVGTRFSVRLYPQGWVDVMVEGGNVTIGLEGNSAPTPVAAGSIVSVRNDKVTVTQDAAEVERRLLWTTGWIEFEDTTRARL